MNIPKWLGGITASLLAVTAWSMQPLSGENKDGQICQKLAKAAPKQTLEQVQKTAQKAGVLVRIVRQDGMDFVLTMDYDPNRLNLDIKAATVMAASCG